MSVLTVRTPAYIFILLLLLPVRVQAESGLQDTAGDSLTITSDLMTVKNKENKAVFENNVVIRKGDLMISADRVEVLMDRDGLPVREGLSPPESVLPGTRIDEGAITKLIAAGHVKFQHGTKHAESREAVYEQREEKIVLLGDPVLFEKEYRVTGTKMTFFLKENKSTIEGSRVLFQPGSEDRP